MFKKLATCLTLTTVMTTFCSTSFASFAAEHSKIHVTPAIKAAVNSSERPASDKSRDKGRKPAEVLSILGVKPGMKVLDLSSGGGYYTDILSRVVGDDGEVVAHNAPFVVNRFAGFFADKKNGWPAKFNTPQWQSNVSKLIAELDNANYGVLNDAAIMVLFYHDTVWQGVNRKMMNRHIFNSLKPGGSYVIVDHSAKAGSGIADVSTNHRIDKQTVIDDLTSVGFELALDSDLLANPKDTRDYPFTRDVQTNRDQTDRMVLKFVKPGR